MDDITALKHALPYIGLFKDKTFVIKLGGETMNSREALEALIDDVSFLHHVGIRVILVHGGGVHVNRLAEQLGVEVQFVGGRRITDERSLEILKLALPGKVSTDILAALKKKGIPALPVSGVAAAVADDGAAGVIEARRRPPRAVTGSGGVAVDFGFVGDIVGINAEPVKMLLKNGYVPVVSPLGADDQGNVLNINADTVACRLAAAVDAHKLLLMTATLGVMGDLQDPTTLISRLTAAEARHAIETAIVTGGMIPKIEESLRALEGGVRQVHILSGVLAHQILLEVFTPSGCGTMLVP